ncbi:MAG: hypothetical protein AB8B87_04460 [Granulosicoccus sp.]
MQPNASALLGDAFQVTIIDTHGSLVIIFPVSRSFSAAATFA